MSECCVIFTKGTKTIVLIYRKSLTVLTPFLNLGWKADSRQDGGNRVLVIGAKESTLVIFKMRPKPKSVFSVC